MNNYFKLKGLKRNLILAVLLLGGMTAQAQWTDANTGVTFTPISGTTGYNGEDWGNGCDGSTSTKHGGASNAGPWYMVLQASEEVKLTGYTITTANDNASNAGRSPYTWKIQGSNTNNGSDWVDIASVTYDNTIQNVNYTEYEFSCSTDNYYTYFRFYITAINGGNYMQYSEFHPIGEVRPLEPGTSGGGGSTGPTSVGYVITNGSVYLGGTSTDAIGTFNPKTCLWTGTSGGTWRNSAGYYLRYNYGLTLNASNASNWTLSGTENGNTGQKINQNNQSNRYIRYNSGWTLSNSNNATNAVFAVTKTTYNASYTVPAIGGATIVSSLGSNDINTIATNAAYTQKYYDYIFRNGAHHYVDDNDETYLGTTAPSASTFTYIWSLEGADGYATIDSSNGQITYSNSTSSDFDVTVKLTATSTKKTFVVTKTVTLKPVRIYYQVNATAEPSAGGKVYVGTSSGTPSNSTATISGNVLGSTSGVSITPYLIAAANDGYEFKWWSTTSEGSSASGDATYHPTVSLNLNSTTPGNADVRNYYAQFGLKPTFYFAANAVAVGGGTANASVTNSSKPGDHWNSTSATTTAQFTATWNSSTHRFLGWSETAEGAIVSTANPLVVSNFESTSTNSGSPATITRYARFQAYPTSVSTSEESLTICTGNTGTFTYSFLPAGAYENFIVNSSNTSKATVSVDGNTVTVTGVAAGTATITVAARDISDNPLAGISHDVEVTVQGYVVMPTISYNSSTHQIEITTTTTGADIYYTTDGSTPTTSSTHYTAPFTQSTAAVINAIAVKSGMCDSPVATTTLNQPDAPVITLNADNTVTITCATTGATIYYTTDGNDPTFSSNEYSSAFALPGSPVTIKAVAILNGVYSVVTSKNLTGTVPTPEITINGSGQVVMSYSGSPTGATIRYTTDGTDPTEESAVYSGPIALNSTIYKARAFKEGYNSSAVATYTPDKVATPEIEITTTTVNFTCATTGVTFYYTTDGTMPTTSSSSGSSIAVSGITDGATIKVIAVKTGMLNSDVATKTFHPASGLYSNTVVLNDLEDHSWSYYSDGTLPSQLRSLNPVDVKITYYGNGSYNISTTNGATPAGNSWTKSASTVKVGPSDNCNTFVYYKTLERLDGSTSNNPTGMCAYTVIPNPFSVRPTYQYASGDLNKYCGFYVWRIKNIKNGKIYTAAVDGSLKEKYDRGKDTSVAGANMLYAGSTYYFKPDSAYGMEVELEALWARAYVVTSGTNGANNIGSNNVGYERNFLVLTTNNSYRFGGNNNRRISNIGYEATISRYYPDGTVGSTSATVRGNYSNSNIELSADTKFENLAFSDMGSATLNAAGHELVVGRGVTGTVNNLCGLNANQSTGFSFRIESGSYNNLYFMNDGYALSAGIMMATMGCDYDRAIGANNNLSINTDITVAKNATLGSSNNKGAEIFNCTVKSGSFDLGESMYAGGNQFYLSNWGNNNYIYGKRKLTVEGGIFSDIAGGMDDDGTENVTMVEIRIKGGTMNSVVYGAAQRSDAQGHRIMVITGGLFKGWIAGGANGTATGDNANGELTGNTYIYVGGNAEVNSNGSTSPLNRALGGNVFGAGCGYGSGYSSGLVTGITNVVIADNAYIERGVYGGGSYGYTTQTSNIYILGGTIDCVDGGVNGTSYLATVDGGVYGGACQNQGGTTNITMNGGTVNGSVYGGSNYTGTLSGTSTVMLNGGTINGSLYGGGNGEGSASTNVTGAVQVTVNGGTVTGDVYGCNNHQGAPQSTVAVDIYGTDPAPSAGTYALNAVFGGGNQANYSGTPTVRVHNCDNSIKYVYGGGNAATVTGTNVTIYGGNRIGEVYIGGYGADVNGNAVGYIKGGTIGRVFAGNNSTGSITGTATVNIDTARETGHERCPMNIGAVFHGGNQAGSAQRTVNIVCTGTADEGIDTLFGGANNAAISGNITLNVSKGHIRQGIFGGNNSGGKVAGNITVNITKDNSSTCTFDYPSVFGGGFGAGTSTGGNITVNIGDKNATATAPTIVATIEGGAVYGGSALGSVNDASTEKTTTNIYNGTITGNIYGGGLGEAGDATKGRVIGKVYVNIGASDQTDAKCQSDLSACSVYGCNNTNGSPQDSVFVNIYRTGHTTKNAASYHTAADSAFAINAVFGGGNLADYTPANKRTTVHIYNCNNTIDSVFGGGNAAAAVGVTTLIEGGRFGWVFGGGNGAVSPANIGSGGTNLTVKAGRIEHLFGGSNEQGSISGTMTTNINHENSDCEELIHEFFGGANLAPINTNLNTTIACGTIFDTIYGGSNLADITGNVTLTVTGGTIGGVYGGSKGTAETAADISGNVTLNLYGGAIGKAFGGSNVNGNIGGAITVNMDWSQSACTGKSLGYLYGGGNNAAYSHAAGNYPAVNIKHGTVTHDVFGGGLGSGALVTGNPKVTVGDLTSGHESYTAVVSGDVYGGGQQAPVTGNTSVTLQQSNTSVTNVFGGGSQAGVSGTTQVAMSGGTVTTALYGGCNASGTVGNGTTVNMTGGSAGYLYGGGYGDGTTVNKGSAAKGAVVTLNGTTATVGHDVYGGGYGGAVNGGTQVDIKAGTVTTDVYGGGYSAPVGGATLVNIGSVGDDTFNNVVIGGSVFGANNTAGTPTGNSEVHIYSLKAPVSPAQWSLTNVYGGGNVANYVPTANGAKAIVEVHNCFNKIQYVYGGGNAATVPETQVTIHGGTIGYVYGGGYGSNSTSAHVGYKTTGVTPASATASDTNGTGNTSVTIKGGAITSVFGGNNSVGTVRGTATVSIAKEGGCTMDITNVYGGGNVAPCTRTAVNIGCTGSEPIDYVFGGANAAPVTGSIALNITGGKIGSAFGGNNASGAIGGTVAVTVEWGGDCDKSLGYVFGGGKDAAYDGTPTVNIKNGTVTYDVFGGGKGSGATVTGTSVTVGDLTSGHDSYAAVVRGGVYGGGQQAAVNGNASVTIQKSNTQVNSVFGGGQQASVTGTADIDMTLGTVTAGIYGGCNVQGAVGGTATLDITGGTVGAAGEGHSANIYGGGLGADTRMSGNVVVNIGATTGGKTPTYSGSATLYGNVYGGSAKGKTNCTDAATPAYVSDTKTDVNLYGGTVNGSLFGGGHGIDNAVADVYGPVTVTVAGGKVTGGVFGCNDQNGTPKGTVTVNITGSAADANAIANVFGGGNVAHYDPTPSTNGYPQVTVSGCSTKVGNVHGGGNAAAVPQTSVVINGGIIANVFGGGLGQAAPAHVGYKNTDNTPSSYPYGNGTASVAIHGGRIGNVYGGNNAGGTVRGKITATADWSDTNCNSKSLGYLYGGGYGAKTRTNGDVEVNISGATVTHDVYGGSALGSVCDAASDTVTVNVLAGTVNGNIYGGGLGMAESADSGQVNGTVIVNIGNSSGGSAIIGGMVFGCNNTNGSPKGDVYVNVYHTAHTDSVNDFAALMAQTTGDTVADLNAVAALLESDDDDEVADGDALFAIKAVYGGGNQADYNPANLTTDTCHVHIYGCTENTIKYVYGGGRAASSNLTDVVIEGGHIYQAFAGGDGSSGTGANIGYLPDGTTEHGPGNTNITVMGGAIYQTFGGSNTLGKILGTSTVDLNKSCNQLNIVEVFGGNNLAPFYGDKVVTIKCGTKWNDVYGGSNKAPITGNVTLNIVGGKMNRAFGGSKAAMITGDVTVNVYGGSIGELYGGNNVSHNITGKITVNVDWTAENTCSDTKYLGYVYGGGNMAAYTPDQVDNKVITSPEVNIIKGTVSHAVFGGGYGSGATVTANPLVVIGADRTKNMAGTTIATVSNQSVTIGTAKNTTGATVDGNVFGGGNAAAVTGNTTVIVKGTGTTVYNNIYGGGNAATVTGSTDVHIGADPIVPEPEPEPEP